MYYYMHFEGTVFVAGTSAPELLQFHAASFPDTIVFESDEKLEAIESLYNAGYWAGAAFHANNFRITTCPRCGALVSDRSVHVEWHLNNEVARVPSSTPYQKGQLV